jgi:PAS domain S-box-containing protein
MAIATYTLLIVEDFPADREKYRRCLADNSNGDYNLLEVESAEDGLELCRAHPVDAILLDYSLPGADGIDFLRALQSQSNGNSPPVIMVTGEGDEKVAVQAIKLGAEDYLIKRDLTSERLQLTVRRAVENSRLQKQLQQYNERFRISLDNMLDCVGIYSAIRDESGQIIDFRFDYLNATALESNVMLADDIGKRLCEVFPSVRETGLFDEYCQVVETGESLTKENLVYSDTFGVQQLTRAYDVHISRLNDGFVAAWRDVTVRKQTELTLSEANRQITSIWESMTDAYVTLDGLWRIIYANRTAAQVIHDLVGLRPEEFLGKTHWEIFPWSVGGTIEREYRRAVAEQVSVHFEMLYEPTPSWFEIHAYPSAEGLGIYFRDINDRKRLEIERIQAEQERDRFFNLSLDMLAIANFEGYFLRLNPAWEQRLGFTSAELMAQPYFGLVHPEDIETTIACAQALREGEVAVNFENRYRCKDGSYRWLSWSATSFVEQNLVYAIAHDITERKQAEALLRENERKFSAIFNQTFEYIGLLDLDGVLMEVNQAALDSIAARPEDVLGKPFWETPWWTHSEPLQQQLQDAIAQVAKGEFIRYEVEFPSGSGAPIISDFSLKPVFDEADQVVMMIGEGRDITDRKQAEERLQESEARLRTGVEVAGVALAKFDYNSNRVTLSPEAAALYGFSADELTVSREQIHARFHPDEGTELLQCIEQVINPQSGGWLARDHRVVWPNGEVRWLSVRQRVFFDRSAPVPHPSYAILAAIDITERRRTQSDLEERNQELDSFVYIVSHDLKAPLRGISNLSRWMEEDLQGALSAAMQRQMELLRNRVHRMEAMIDGLLDYARVGRRDATIETVAVAELLAEVMDSLAPPPTFTIAIAPDLPTLSTKRLPLSQVLANLIGNSIKHHNRADGLIRISGQDRGDLYEFRVSDDGPGIAPEYHDRIFMIFQAGNPQKSQDSTGIGLAIVKKIVEGEGGTIRVESQPEKGTTFYFTWPKNS